MFSFSVSNALLVSDVGNSNPYRVGITMGSLLLVLATAGSSGTVRIPRLSVVSRGVGTPQSVTIVRLA